MPPDSPESPELDDPGSGVSSSAGCPDSQDRQLRDCRGCVPSSLDSSTVTVRRHPQTHSQTTRPDSPTKRRVRVRRPIRVFGSMFLTGKRENPRRDIRRGYCAMLLQKLLTADFLVFAVLLRFRPIEPCFVTHAVFFDVRSVACVDAGVNDTLALRIAADERIVNQIAARWADVIFHLGHSGSRVVSVSTL